MGRAGGKLAVVLALVLALLASASAQARSTKLVDAHGRAMHGKVVRWIRAARAPLVPGRVQLVIGPCPGAPRLVACVQTRHPRRIYMGRSARPARMVLYHELGHVFDLRVLSRSARRRFRRIMHLRRAWFQGPVPPAELFADAYARCARFGRVHSGGRLANPTRSVYGYHPTLRQHRAVCTLIARAAGPRRRPQPPRRPPPLLDGPSPQPPPAQQAPPPPPNEQSGGLLDALLGQQP
jgi:hypothetical protein